MSLFRSGKEWNLALLSMLYSLDCNRELCVERFELYQSFCTVYRLKKHDYLDFIPLSYQAADFSIESRTFPTRSHTEKTTPPQRHRRWARYFLTVFLQKVGCQLEKSSELHCPNLFFRKRCRDFGVAGFQSRHRLFAQKLRENQEFMSEKPWLRFPPTLPAVFPFLETLFATSIVQENFGFWFIGKNQKIQIASFFLKNSSRSSLANNLFLKVLTRFAPLFLAQEHWEHHFSHHFGLQCELFFEIWHLSL